jgi:hypothetical protein
MWPEHPANDALAALARLAVVSASLTFWLAVAVPSVELVLKQ